MKENLNRAIASGDVDDCMDLEATHHVHCGQTEDHRNAVAAFVETRTGVQGPLSPYRPGFSAESTRPAPPDVSAETSWRSDALDTLREMSATAVGAASAANARRSNPACSRLKSLP